MKYFGTLVALAAVAASLVEAMPRSPFEHRRGLAKKAAGNPKLVVAHHMVGNTYPYGPQDWESDIKAAPAAGIDDFALKIGKDSWQPSQIDAA